MLGVNSNGASKLVKDHAEAFSAQSKLSNRLWITLIALIFVVVLPVESSSCPKSAHNLPFGIGCVDPTLFDPISFFMLAVLTIAFCQAHAEAIRAYRRAQNDIDKMGERTSDLVKNQRQFFDTLSIPSLSRVGSLPVLILAVFYPSNTLTILASIYYLVLKGIAVLVHLGIPLFAFVFVWNRLQGSGEVPCWVLWAGTATGVVTLLALVQILVVEGWQIWGTFLKFKKGEIEAIKLR